jgi:hypothetical protein
MQRLATRHVVLFMLLEGNIAVVGSRLLLVLVLVVVLQWRKI